MVIGGNKKKKKLLKAEQKPQSKINVKGVVAFFFLLVIHFTLASSRG